MRKSVKIAGGIVGGIFVLGGIGAAMEPESTEVSVTSEPRVSIVESDTPVTTVKPSTTTTEAPTTTVPVLSIEEIAELSAEQVWNDIPEWEKQELCALYLTFPYLAEDAFKSGIPGDPNADILWDAFEMEMLLGCLDYI